MLSKGEGCREDIVGGGGGGGWQQTHQRYNKSPTSKINTTWACILSDCNVFCTRRGGGKRRGLMPPVGLFLLCLNMKQMFSIVVRNKVNEMCGTRKCPYLPHRRSLEIPSAEGGSQYTKIFKQKYESKLDFPTRVGKSKKKTFLEEWEGYMDNIFWCCTMLHDDVPRFT